MGHINKFHSSSRYTMVGSTSVIRRKKIAIYIYIYIYTLIIVLYTFNFISNPLHINLVIGWAIASFCSSIFFLRQYIERDIKIIISYSCSAHFKSIWMVCMPPKTKSMLEMIKLLTPPPPSESKPAVFLVMYFKYISYLSSVSTGRTRLINEQI